MGPVIRGAITDVVANPKFQKAFKTWIADKAWQLGEDMARKRKGYTNASSSAYGRPYDKKRAVSYASHASRSTNTDAVQYNDMGDRGGVTRVAGRRRSKRRMPFKKRRRLKRFKRAVRKAVYPKAPLCCLQEFWPTEATWNASTVDTFGSQLNANRQLILGNADPWGINIGENNAAGGNESNLINKEMGDYRIRISGTDITASSDNMLRDNNAHYVKRRYLKLTVRNRSTDKDLSFSLYECVAATDIADATYANPVIALLTLNNAFNEFQTATDAGELYARGTEPTDCPGFGKYWKILTKYKVRIPFATNINNATQTFKMHSKPYMRYGQRFNGKWAVKGLTKYFMMIVEPEQGPLKYTDTDTCIGVFGHRNTHYRPMQVGTSMHAHNAVANWFRHFLSTPTL